jgi:hypothetical protein
MGFGLKFLDIIKNPILLELKYIDDFENFYTTDFEKLWNQVFVLNIGIEL